MATDWFPSFPSSPTFGPPISFAVQNEAGLSRLSFFGNPAGDRRPDDDSRIVRSYGPFVVMFLINKA